MQGRIQIFILLAVLAASVVGSQSTVSEQELLYGLTIRSCCRAVDVLVVDPQGRRTGVDPCSGATFGEIPGSTYSPDTGMDDDETGQPDPDPGKEIEIMGPQSGLYSIHLVAREQTRYQLELRAFDQSTSRDARQALMNLSISKGDIHRYRLHYDRDPSPGLVLTGALKGGGKEPESTDGLLSYAAPGESRMTLGRGTHTCKLVVFYDAAVAPTTFTAELNGADVSSRFHPAANTAETVEIPLRPGMNTLTLSVKGRTQKDVVKDTDRLTFTVRE